MILHHTWVGDPSAPQTGFVLHGVLGAGHNFRSFAKRLVDARPEYRLALIDLRYHGRSLGAPPPHTLESCVTDLRELTEQLGFWPNVVIGHSLGGKVALGFGRRVVDGTFDAGRTALRQVWALDSDPGAQTPAAGHQVLQVFGAIRRHPGPFSSRAEATETLLADGLSAGLSHWLVTSLERATPGDSALTWRFDLDGIEGLLTDYFQTNLWPFLEERARTREGSPSFELLVAERSDRWSGSMREHAELLPKDGALHVHELEDAGHWVHVDNPDGLLRILASTLS